MRAYMRAWRWYGMACMLASHASSYCTSYPHQSMRTLLQSSAIYRPIVSWMMSLRASSTWHAPFIDSHGDYQQEASSLFEPPDTPLYRHQRDLPRLPVPTLEETIDCFLPTALPLAETKEEAETLQRACHDFLTEGKAIARTIASTSSSII